MAEVELTANAVQELCNGRMSSEENKFEPTLQVSALKELSKGRWKCQISDGANITSAFVASQLDEQVKAGDIADTTIFKLVKYNLQTLPNKANKAIMIIGVEVLEKTAPAKGDPKPFAGAAVTVKTEVKQEMMSPVPSKSAPVDSPAPGGPAAPTPTNTPPKAPAMTGSPIAMSTGDQNVVPIADINPYMGRWSMKGRIIAKKPMRTFQGKGGGEKKVFDLTIMDESCDIKVTFWDENCDKYYDYIEVGKCYTISKGRLTPANSRYNDTKSQYEMSATPDVTIMECLDAEAPKMRFSFTAIDKLESLVGTSTKTVDVIGIVSEVQALGEIQIKNGPDAGKMKAKRNIAVADQSGKMVSLTLWDEHAMAVTEEQQGNNTILAVRAVRISDYNGCSLSTTRASMVQVDPELKEAEAIKEWLGTRMDTAFQAVGTGGKGGAAGPAPRRAMSDIARLGLGLEKTEVFTVRATVMYFRNKEKDGMQTNWQYPSNPENKKKVVQSGDQWVDESTGKVMDACQRRYILGLSACDSTGSSYLTAFDDQAKAMLGKSADELYDMHQVDEAGAQSVWNAGLFRNYVLKIRAKNERYQDQDRVKCSILDVSPVNYKEESRLLIEEIRKYGIEA